MSWDVDFEELMPETVLVEKVLTRDDFGVPVTYSGYVPYRARILRDDMVDVDDVGPVWQRAMRIYLAGAPEIAQDDRITLPDKTQPPIDQVIRRSDDGGDHHTVISVRFRR